MVPASDLATIRWYFDESLLGAAKLLDATRADVVRPGHPLVPHLPLGTPDTQWIPMVARAGWVAFVRDRRIRTRPAEAEAFRAEGLRIVFFGGKKDQTPADQAALFTRNLDRLERVLVKEGPGPWAYVLTGAGLAPLRRRA